MESEYSNIDKLAMLIELGIDYHKKLRKALADDDQEQALYFSEMFICTQKLLKDIDKEDGLIAHPLFFTSL